MQKIKIAHIEIKEGDNDRGHWQNFIITGEDKAKVSTFDHSAASLKVGDTIEAEIELKGKFANLKSFQMVQKALETADKPPPSQSKDQSNEQQVAVKAVVKLVVGEIIGKDHPLVKGMLDWCAVRLCPNAQISQQNEQGIGDNKKEVEPSKFANIGELLSACDKIKTAEFPKGVSRVVAMNIWRIKESELPNLNLSEAWQQVQDHVKMTSKLKELQEAK